MKRPPWVTGVVVAQTLWTLALVAFPVYLLALTRSRDVLNLDEAKETVYGLKIAAGLFAIPALLGVVSTLGLWRGKPWGWWLTVVSNTLMFVALIYSMIDDGTLEWDMFALTVVSAVLPALL